MTVTAVGGLAVGDRVYLGTDPRHAEGTVSLLDAGRVFVTWDIGRTWVYASSQLVKVSP